MRRSPLLIPTFSSAWRRLSSRFAAPSLQSGGLRCLCVIVTLGVLSDFSLPTAHAQDAQNTVVSDPYLVFVADESAHLRCGPSGEYYRTDPLRHGQELEVYVETADGWLGVRPTEDSFCWIPADTVKLLDSKDAKRGSARSRDGSKSNQAIEAEIIENKTVAWIGTNLGRARRYHWQVRLGEGEIVTILGSSERDGPDGPQTWYRVVPPSGEFRWVHREQVVTTAEELIAGLKPAPSSEPIEFLPGGPTAVPKPTEPLAQRIASSISRASNSTLDRVSHDQVWDDSLDEIEERIRSRQRSRFERSESPDDAINNDGSELSQSEPTTTQSDAEDPHAHHPRSFSQRVTEGLSSIMRGRKPQDAELEPITGTKRRIADLVPIGSEIARTSEAIESQRAESQSADVASDDSNVPSANIADQHTGETHPSIAEPKTVAAMPQPGFRSDHSQVAILSAPRMVTPASVAITTPATPVGSGVASTAGSNQPASFAPASSQESTQGFESRFTTKPAVTNVATLSAPLPIMDSPTSPGSSLSSSNPLNSSRSLGHHLAPQRTRTISSTQLEDVRRSVASATAETLPVELSKLMSRGASAPEIALIAEAAEQSGDNRLAVRARDYQALARRRDGDTIVSTAIMPPPMVPNQVVPTQQALPTQVVSTPTFTTSPGFAPIASVAESANGQFVPRTTIATTSYTPPVAPIQQAGPVLQTGPVQQTAGQPQAFASIPTEPIAADESTTGILVEVYSADPSRPPYAITDRGGRTIAYVTPAPGVDVKRHLGSEVQITGESGYLQGLDTPHVLATATQRVQR
ncbi:SH3 domain-containing protein [Neorhodopirellula lusitana]|uniref:hypothetical protein n=1 Tax=Neorhodopirellula lusitana TaxID=445327 RepID=UPI00384C4D8E